MNLKQRFFTNVWGDVMGGVMTTVVALPIAMAFGVASGLGAAAGLYGAMACGFFAAIFGGTRGQQSGPTGPIAVIVAALLVAHHNPELAFAATLVAGILQIIFGRFGAGRIAEYVPYPVVSGFMTGIALIIVIMHVHPLFGLEGPKNIASCIADFISIPQSVNSAALTLGLCTFGTVFLLKKLSKKLPGALLALVGATVASSILSLDVPRIGAIPNALPLPKLPVIGMEDAIPILIGGTTIAVLASIDSLLTSLIADNVTQSKHDSNRELIGQGIGNIASGLIGGMPGAGSTTRTIANIDAGGRTALSGVVYGGLVLAVIAGLGQFAAVIPLSALAAILIWLGIGIIDWRMMKHLKRAPREDVIVMFTVLALTLFVDLIWAIIAGCALACVLLVRKMIVTSFSRYGFLDAYHEYSASRIIADEQKKQIFIYEFGQPLFFGEAKNMQSQLDRLANTTRFIVLIFRPPTFIDQSACYLLETTIRTFSSRNTDVLIVGLDNKMKAVLSSMDCKESIRPDRQFAELSYAIEHIAQRKSTLTRT